MPSTLENYLKGLISVVFILLSIHSIGQKTTIQDYVIFGGSGNYLNTGSWSEENEGCQVVIGNKSTITNGAIGSFQFIKTTGEVSIGGNVFSGGKISLSSKNTVSGKIAAGNSSGYNGDILKTGSYGNFIGNINVNGNISIGSKSKVEGTVTLPSGSSYSGPAPKGGKIVGTLSLPGLPDMPPVTDFPTAGSKSIYGSETILPGAYNKIELKGYKTITFSGTGVYVFNSINNQGTNNFIFDFKNNSTGTVRLYIYGNVDLDNIKVQVINGGEASRIYTEVHGNGKSCWDKKSSWTMGGSWYCQKKESNWEGTVWAPYGPITVGTSSGNPTITGALLSGKEVNIGNSVTVNFAPFSTCNTPDVNAGPDKDLNVLSNTKLEGSSTSPSVNYNWYGLDGAKILSGANSATAEVAMTGKFVLKVSSGEGCFATDTVLVTGKNQEIIGSELKSLFLSGDTSSPLSKSIFLIQNDSVFVEVIALEGEYNTVLSILQSSEFGMTDFITNGRSKYIITGKIAIANLLKLNDLAEMVNFCRPLYPPLTNAGIAQTAGDSAMRTNFVRNSFGVQGEGITIGVLSDSYNTLPGNPANNDVVNGDLPGFNNSNNSIPVKVLKDYPYGRRTDEGRAMLQIIHDVAPKANLSFRTGFISAGDLGEGIKQLANDGCNVIVDDITFITEPFFLKGTVDSAIAEVTSNGVVYVTSAGNFANKSYGAIFNPANAPGGLSGKAHNFGGGDVLQNVSLSGSPASPGIYTVVLQWVDDIYSLSGEGTKNDLDIYLADENGNPILGFNRNNLDGDPIEVLPFNVTNNTSTNILIINNSLNPSPNLRFKFVVFRGDLKINEYSSESSTIVGHGNSEQAITVGAARYSKTPAYGESVPLLESFSSIGGGIMATGFVSQKPDLVGPDGVNTTVSFGNVDSEGDGLPNFFGTSAAAPHVAGAAALLLQAGKKFYNQTFTSATIKNTFQNTAIDMDAPGFDFSSGHGFINAYAALQTIANPSPQIDSLQFLNPDLIPGSQPMPVIVHGNYFSSDTKVILGKDTLETTINSTTQATIILPIFFSDKLISAYSPSITPSALDGGISNSISVDGIPKKTITLKADNKTKKYGTILPDFSTTILVDGDSLQNTNITLEELGLTNITYQSPANDLSNVGIYFIRPVRTFDENNPDDQTFLEKYNYQYADGALTITKLPLKITARDTTLIYGQKAGGFGFNYTVDASADIGDKNALINNVVMNHEGQLAGDVIGLVNGQAVVIVNGQAIQIVNGQAVQIVNGQAVVIVNGQAIQIVNGQAIQIVNGQAVQIVNNLTESEVDNLNFMATTTTLQGIRELKSTTLINGVQVPQITNVVDITQESILKFNQNSAQTTLINAISNVSPRGLVDATSYTNGQAVQIVNGQAIQIVNGQAVQIVNGQAVQIVNGQAVTIVNGQAIPIVNGESRSGVIINEQDIGFGVSEFKSLNMVTGLDAGVQFIIPATFTNDNFDVSYGVGKLKILPAPLTIELADANKKYGDEIVLDSTAYSIQEGALMYDDMIENIPMSSTGSTINAMPGSYPITPVEVRMKPENHLSNYDLSFINGKLTVGKASLIVKANDATKEYGDANPVFTATFQGLLNDETPESSGISGTPSFETSATTLSNTGFYRITPSTGTLLSNKYSFVFENGMLQITPAPLYVTADDKVIFQKSKLPEFTAQVSPLKTNTIPKISFKVEPYYSGNPGVYAIIPKANFAEASNYIINYTNGKLYVNPKCGNAKILKVYLDCVEKIGDRKYIAHFKALNENSTTMFIPKGWNNFVYSFGSFDASGIPEVFNPGITTFDVPFDGHLITWVVSSYEKCWYLPYIAAGSYYSKNCADNLITSNSTTSSSAMPEISKNKVTDDFSEKIAKSKNEFSDNKTEGVLRVYPNPVQNKAIIYLSNEKISEKGTVLYDVNGKSHPLKLVRQISPNSIEIDMSDLQKGYYLIKVKVSNGYRSIMIIKG